MAEMPSGFFGVVSHENEAAKKVAIFCKKSLPW